MFRIRKPLKDIWHITVFHNGLAKWYKSGRHQGIDLRTRNADYPHGIGMPIYAAASGEWEEVKVDWLMGRTVILKHKDGYQTVYGHLSKTTYQEGWKNIKAGDIIGYSGNTGKFSFGPHLHFEVRQLGYSLDPLPFIEAGNKLRAWARARALMRVENRGEIKFLLGNGVVDLNEENCWKIISKNSWGISENDFKNLLDLL